MKDNRIDEKMMNEKINPDKAAKLLSGLIRVYKELTGKEDITQLQVEDALGRCNRQVVINEDGYGEFSVHGKSVSVWIPRL